MVVVVEATNAVEPNWAAPSCVELGEGRLADEVVVAPICEVVVAVTTVNL